MPAEPLAGLPVGSLPPLHTTVGGASQVELAVFLLIGLLGGAHCLGMCGPLVTIYAERLAGRPGPDGRAPLTAHELRQHALFNLGRVASYAVLGAAFGLLGALVFDAAALVTAVGDVVRGTAGVLVGVGILVVGARYAAGDPGGLHPGGSGPTGALFARVYGLLTSGVDRRVRGPGIVGLGAVHGLLPCPLLYPAFLYAFARGSPTVGAVALGVLGLGTFPTLFLYGTAVGSLSADRRRRLHRALGVAFLVLGFLPLAHGLALLGVPIPHIEVPYYQPL